MDPELFGEFLQCHLVVIPTGNVAGPDRSLLSKSLSHQELLDDQGVEHWFLRRRPALRIEIVGDLSSGRPLGTQHRDPIQYFVVMLELFKASHGSNDRMCCHDPACPVAFYFGTFGLSEHPDDHAIEHHTGDSLSVSRCSGLRLPQGRHIFCQLANRVLFLRR